MKRSLILGIASMLLLASCVSMSDYRKLETDFADYKQSMQSRQARLEEDMKIFKMGYDPKANEIFSNNVILANNYYAEIKNLRDEIASMNYLLTKIKSEAESAKDVVLDNAKTSQSQNVVNEFYYLRRQWENTVNEMNKMVFVAQQSVSKAQTAASDSYEKVVLVEKAAKTVNEMAKNVNEIMNTLQSLTQRIAGLEQGAVQDKKNYADIQKTIDEILGRMKAISERINILEKKVLPEKQNSLSTVTQ